MKIIIIFITVLIFTVFQNCKAQDKNEEANKEFYDKEKVNKLSREIDSLNNLITAIKELGNDGMLKTDTKATDLIELLNKEKDLLITKRADQEQLGKPNDFRSIFGWNKSKTGTAVGNFWNDLDKKGGVINLGLPVFDNQSSLYGEALLDYIGAFRIALSTSVTASKQTDTGSSITNQSETDNQTASSEAIQNFISSGGNILIKSDFPLLYLANLHESNPDNRNTRSIGIYASCRISLNAPALGGSVNVTDGLAEIAVEPVLNFQTNQKLIGFTARIRFGVAVTSPYKVTTFTGQTEGGKTFGYIMASIILKIKESFAINFYAPVSWWNSERPLDRAPVSLTIGTTF